ncbi:glycosyl transferase [Aggregatibacter actinomycetemcomitans]|uniref:glycosyltransferase family 32 protein n=1 Tax=Aggregatibacter actinomycetemcomitans TaxID=714 RepID=UPI00197BA0CE|nr:glycosyltransferase [Aggregatibacter actinomycetemcomitans]MBN6071201.1 glycosyl transferase [Aggregatibacter actinomycetemcomitans]
MNNQIPKKIHYIWVGTKEKPQLVIDCINSWKAILPDYEIIEWNNDSLKKINNDYASEAYKNKKWAFVSDYLRLYALYHEGGIYLDSDVEVTQNIDQFLHLEFFSGYEIYGENKRYFPITALMAAQKHNSIIKDLLDEYNDIHFETEVGLDLTPNTFRISEYFKRKFNIIEPYNGENTTKLNEKSIIYPYYYFCTPKEGSENFSIHHFNGSWKPSHERKDKLNIFNKFIISRFKKRGIGDLPINPNEEILFSIRISTLKSYVLIKIKN